MMRAWTCLWLSGAAAILAGTPASAAAVQIRSFDAFVAEESALQRSIDAASDDAEAASRLTLARFYAARGLHVEALAALDWRARGAGDDATRLVLAASSFALGRFDDVLDLLADERIAGRQEAAALRAMALARLGAFERATAEFENVGAARPASPYLAGEFLLLKARSALASGDRDAARDLLEDARAHAAAKPEIELAAAEIALAGGAPDARARLSALADDPDRAVAARAALALLIADANARRIARAEVASGLDAVRMRSSGPEFERAWLAAAAALAPHEDPARAIDAFRRLADRHSASDAGSEAKRALSGLVARLAEREDLPPRTIARIFYENIEFAPTGADGDALIRRLAARLDRLDLLSEAAELLEHQVFKRLRGPERTRVAADLAETYLKDRRPSEALRVIRSTRIAGLDPAANERRRLIEATALERVGAPAAALELLGDSANGPALALRADIEWRARDWAGAAASYRRIAAAASPPLDASAKSAVLRAATAYLLSGDRDGFEGFRNEIEPRLGALAETDLIAAMSLETADARAGFLNAYRAVFAP